jgi:pimeloyl-ACP methyl ester carboxylesterase
MAADDRFRHRQVAVRGASVHVAEAGDPAAPPVVFLHGWPESWRSWIPVIELASSQVRAIAIDLPGVGESTGDATDGSKREIAALVHDLLASMDLRDVTLVGHDVGGMVAYAYLRAHGGASRVAIMDVVIPGLDPWERVISNPYIWHFAMHAIPDLPERLVQGRQAEYFDYFFEVIAADATRITPEARAAYVQAYRADSALTAGFNWYRSFARDAAENRETAGRTVTTPVLYVRGEHETGHIDDYASGLRAAGVTALTTGTAPGAGHFVPEEAPTEAWRLIADFIGL